MDDEEQQNRMNLRYSIGGKMFNDIVVDAINETLTTFGESFRQVVLFHIEKQSGVSEEELPNRLEVFHQALFSIFSSGARKLELEILNRLFHKLGLSFNPRTPFKFMDEVKRAKKSVALYQGTF